MTGSQKRLLRWRRPAVQADLPLPDPQAPSQQDSQPELPWWQRRAAVATLAALAAAFLVLTIASQLSARRERANAVALAGELKTATLRAPTRDRALRVRPNPRSWSAAPDATIAWPEPPELIELFMPVGYARYREFAVTIDTPKPRPCSSDVALACVSPTTSGTSTLAGPKETDNVTVVTRARRPSSSSS